MITSLNHSLQSKKTSIYSLRALALMMSLFLFAQSTFASSVICQMSESSSATHECCDEKTSNQQEPNTSDQCQMTLLQCTKPMLRTSELASTDHYQLEFYSNYLNHYRSFLSESNWRPPSFV